jgi:RNA polymerase primary sigma factor
MTRLAASESLAPSRPTSRGTVASPRAAEPGALGPYYDAIRGDPLLSAEEERALARAVAAGDRAARDRLIRANLRLVVRVARDYAGMGLPPEDLIGEGNLGLLRAAEGFDPAFGTRFSTYAAHWIRQAIRAALTNTAATIRLPAHMVGLLRRWRRAERALRRERGREPGFDEVADRLGLSPEQRELVGRARRASRLRRGGRGEDGRERLPDEVSDPHARPEASLEADDEWRATQRRLDHLDDRERAVVALRFGLGGSEPLTLKEVGHRLGVTREWVRKLEARAVQRLSEAAGARAGRDPARAVWRGAEAPDSGPSRLAD